MTFLDLCISQELVLFLVLFSDRRIGIRFVLWYWRVSGEMGIERVEIDCWDVVAWQLHHLRLHL